MRTRTFARGAAHSLTRVGFTTVSCVSLKYERGRVEPGGERIEAAAVLVEAVVQRERRGRARGGRRRASPSVRHSSRSAAVSHPSRPEAKSTAGASSASPAIGWAASAPCERGRVDGDEPAKARPDQPDGPGRQGGDGGPHLPKHPGDRQRREVRLVEVRGMQRDAERRQPTAQVLRLAGFRRRREAVQVEEVHSASSDRRSGTAR